MNPRSLVLALMITTIGALGWLSGTNGASDPVALVVWLALVSVPCGVLASASGLPPWPHALAIPGVWSILLALCDALARRTLPTPVWTSLAAAGLFLAGFALARASAGGGVGLAAATSVVAAGLCLLPSIGLVLARPFPPTWSAHLLDLSPATLLVECGGVDWMHHPAVYEPAGALDIDFALRSPWQGKLAGPASFLVGSVLVFAAEFFAARRARR